MGESITCWCGKVFQKLDECQVQMQDGSIQRGHCPECLAKWKPPVYHIPDGVVEEMWRSGEANALSTIQTTQYIPYP